MRRGFARLGIGRRLMQLHGRLHEPSVNHVASATAPTAEQVAQRLSEDPYHQLVGRFFQMVRTTAPGKILEIGSRNRSGTVRRDLAPSGWQYVGMDILAGENVDVVGDAHILGEHFDAASLGAVFSFSTFEHLAMPWKAILEINRVLRIDGLVMIASHQTWPVHEAPWDYFRFSDQAWRALLNRHTGFEVLEAVMGEPASVRAHLLHGPTIGLDEQPAFLGSAVLARKVGDTRLSWDVPLADIAAFPYPR